MRRLLVLSALWLTAACSSGTQHYESYEGIEVGQPRIAALEAVNRLWSRNFSTRCWPSYLEFAANTHDATGGYRTRDGLGYFCFADENHWKVWYRADPQSPSQITDVDVHLDGEKVSTIEVRRYFYIDP